MMEYLGLAPSQPKDNGSGGLRPSLLEREMEMMGLLKSGSNDTADNYDDGEKNSFDREENSYDEHGGEVYTTSKGSSTPRRPGKPVRRQRKPADYCAD